MAPVCEEGLIDCLIDLRDWRDGRVVGVPLRLREVMVWPPAMRPSTIITTRLPSFLPENKYRVNDLKSIGRIRVN